MTPFRALPTEFVSRRLTLALPGLLSVPALLTTAPPAAAAQRLAVAPGETRASWHDASRGRDVPVLIRAPAGTGAAAAVLISHGLGGSRDGQGYLGRALCDAGFLVIHLQHPGTDDSLWRGGDRSGLLAAALDVQGAVDRLSDVLFALDRLPDLRAAAPGGERWADPARLAIAGHSYGAWVVQHMLGERVPGGTRGLTLPDPRLRAGVALSPIPARGLPGRVAYAGITAPMLSITGTQDSGYIDGATPADRRRPFEEAGNPGALAVLNGADHAAFADEPAAGARWAENTFHERAAGLSVAFLRAVLNRDAAAADFLRGGGGGLLRPADTMVTRGL